MGVVHARQDEDIVRLRESMWAADDEFSQSTCGGRAMG
jgi:hypothetical protein